MSVASLFTVVTTLSACNFIFRAFLCYKNIMGTLIYPVQMVSCIVGRGHDARGVYLLALLEFLQHTVPLR